MFAISVEDTLPRMSLRLRSKVGLLIFLLACAGGLRADDFEARTYAGTDGKTLPYRLLTPLGYDKDKDTKYPVVFFFHGAGERGADNVTQLKLVVQAFASPANRAKYPCFVIAAQCPNNQQWVDMPWGALSGVRSPRPSVPMGMALKILDDVTAEFNTDPDRIYVVGLSMGGYATWDCITRFPDRFAAAIPICGGGDEKTVTADVAKIPLWAFHAPDDGIVPVVRTRHMIQAMQQAGGNPHYTEYPASLKLNHNCWDRAIAEPRLIPWLFAQRRGQPDPQAPAEPAVIPADAPSSSGDTTKSP